MTEDTATLKSGRSVGLTPDEIWLQDSEARLDSMEMLLKSVKRDIDALSEKLPSPRISRVQKESRLDFSDDNFVRETGCKSYVLSSSPTRTSQFSPLFPPVLPSSEDVEVVHVEHHRMFYNLGLGSHTIAEPLMGMLEDNDTDVCEVVKPTSCADLHALVDESDEQEVKPWRSPADFRTRVSADTYSPPTSPTFGETNDVVSLKNILLHSENVEAYSGLTEGADSKLVNVYGSAHTLPTIEENSEEDRAMTDSENADSSLSAEVGSSPGGPPQDSEIFKSAEDTVKDRSALPPPPPPALGARSYESVKRCVNAEDIGRPQSPRQQTMDKMNMRRENGNLETRRSFERPRSGSPFLTRPKSSGESQGVSGVPSLTSLKSRDSMIVSDAESYVTVRSHIYPSSSCEEAYITACSDVDGVGGVSEDEDVRTFRAHTSDLGDGGDWRWGAAKEKPSKLLVLQQTPNSDSHQHPDDVLEFTLVEAKCETPTPAVNPSQPLVEIHRFADQGSLKHGKDDKREPTKDKNGIGVRRRALRKRTSGLGENPEDSDSGSCGSNEFSNPTSSSEDEAEYDAGSGTLASRIPPTNYPPPYQLSVARSSKACDPSQLSWKRLSSIEEKSCVNEGSGAVEDSDLDSPEETDAVLHFVEMDESASSPHPPLDNQNRYDRAPTNQATSVPSSTNQIRRSTEEANRERQSDQPAHSLADSDEQATTTGGESQATTISVNKSAAPQSTPEVVVPNFSRFPTEVLIPLTPSKVELDDQQSTDGEAQDVLAEEKEETLKMSIMFPNNQVRDIPEGKKQHLQHRHYVSALDETLRPEVELVSSKRGSSKAVATSQVVVQSPRGPTLPSATAIVQAEATAARGSVAAARATAKATGLASESATALAREARRLASPGVVTHASSVTGPPARVTGLFQPESTDDDEAEYDITVSTSCRVTRHSNYSFAEDIPQVSSPHPHPGLILSPHNGVSPHSSQSPDPLSLPILGLVPQPYSRPDDPASKEPFFAPRTDITQRLPIANLVRFEKTPQSNDRGPMPITEEASRQSRSVERDDFVTPVRRARRDCFQRSPSENVTTGEEVFFMGDSATILPSADVLSAPGGSPAVAVAENDKEVENGKVAGDAPPEEPPTKPLYQRRYWQPRTIPCEKEVSKASYRSRSVSRLPDRHIPVTQRALDANEQANASNQAGHMYSRSGSRYRSTDIDAALASSRDNLMGSSYTDATKKEDYVASLFDLTGRRPGNGGLRDIGLQRYPSNHLNGKSTNSLLETDIDTGEHMGQPIILETDVDTLNTYRLVGSIGSGQQDGIVTSPEAAPGKDKSYSLFNLTSICTPGLHRRFAPGAVNTLPPTVEPADVYKRTQSLQGIPDGKGSLDDTKTASRSFAGGAGGGNSRGLIARLRARARSNHELRVAESLTRLDLPEWLDKADLSKPVFSRHESRLNSLPPEGSTLRVEKDSIPRYSLHERRTPAVTTSQNEDPSPAQNDIPSTRPPIGTAGSRIRTVEAVSSPLWSVAPSKETHELRRPLRPSELLRQRDSAVAKGLTPITSKLRSSMRSSSEIPNGTRLDRGTLLSSSLREQADSRTTTGAANSVRLKPDDFLTREQKLWNLRPAPLKVAEDSPPRIALNTTGGALSSAEVVRAPKTPQPANDPSSSSTPRPAPRSSSRITPQDSLVRINGDTHIVPVPQELQAEKAPKCTSAEDSIKLADCDATDSDAFESHLEAGFYQPMESDRGIPGNTLEEEEECIYEEVKRPKARAPPPALPRAASTPRSPPHNGDAYIISPLAPQSPSWRSIDEGGETETQATDGFDKISDLTCLTDLLDRCAGRHLTLLQNRPSALETLLAQLGWWPSVPSAAKSERGTSNSAETIALAAGHFDASEDGHRHEFLALLASPSSQRPIELTEFGLDQVRSGLERNPKDGMLYLRCNNPDCPRVGPTRADKARSWVTCPNCFTAYCSATCRQHAPHGGDVCSFGRARLVCGRILHQLAPCQQVSLTVLAKAGFARLGRGGIVLAFSSVQNAEFFLTRCNALPNHPGADSFLPADGETAATRPSPSGLMAPPIYLTLEELNELDSRVAVPCRTYSPHSSFVLIVIVCAYDIQTVGNGRAVHFFKQGRILPFPVAAASYQPHTTEVVRKPAFEKNLGRGGVAETSLGGWTPTKTTREERELFLKRLQRTLRERGLSLRHHHAEVYHKLEHFVQTGEPFSEVEISFHDYIADQEVVCVIGPMKEAVLQVTDVARQRTKKKPTSGVTETGQQSSHVLPHKTTPAAAAMKLPANRQISSRPRRGVETEL
ncbi:hypothetical protein AAHC03_09453 [Spirometra sp. Aus1]